MIHLAAELFDFSGVVWIKPVANNPEPPLIRRVTRVATLDQGVAITDRGYSEGDRTPIIRFKPVSQEHDDTIKRLIRLHPTVRMTNREGVFQCSIQRFDPTPSENRLTLLVIQKLSEDT